MPSYVLQIGRAAPAALILINGLGSKTKCDDLSVRGQVDQITVHRHLLEGSFAMRDSADGSGVMHARLRTPRAAGIAGVLFSVLLFAVFLLMRHSVPRDPLETGAWLHTGATNVVIALNLVPFAGVAFLWFVGALRDKLGQREDQFFATVFLGSGLLLLAMLFAAAAVVGAIILAFHAAPEVLVNSATFHFGRGLAYGMINIYVVKTASVFMITTSTIGVYTGLTPRWLALGGYVVAAILLVGSYYFDWSLVVFPVWVLLVSISILVDSKAATKSEPRSV